MKGSSTGAVKGTKTSPGKFTVNKPTGKAPIRGQAARISKFHASRGKTSPGFTKPRSGSQY